MPKAKAHPNSLLLNMTTEQRKVYEQNRAAYKEEFTELEKWAQRGFSGDPDAEFDE